MADDLIVEILDQNWTRKAVTNKATKASVTRELGVVGDANVEIPIDDPAADFLPSPDVANPYEGRWRLYEDDQLQFAGVIDAQTRSISGDGASVTFGGKHRGIQLGFYNTGRVDYLGWTLPEVYRELLRNNIGREATLHSTSSEDELYGAYQMVTGDPFKQNYWKSTSGTPNHWAIFQFATDRHVNAIRVIPQWWKDIDTNRFHRHDFTIETSLDGAAWTTRGTKTNQMPSSSKGHLFTFSADVRYFRLTVTGSSDGYARIAQIMVYEDIADIGGETTFVVPFVENDDSGNCVTSGTTTRPITPGAFQGDSVITHSYVTKLGSGGKITHTFRGTSDAVFFTSHNNGASTARIFVDGSDRGVVSIPNNRYWYKGYDTAEDLGELSNTEHTLEVRQESGFPQVDYFNGIYQCSWRPIEADDPSIAYVGSWSEVEAAYFFNFFAAQSNEINNKFVYEFKGDRIRVRGSKGAGFGTITWYIDGVSQGTVNCNTGTTQTNKQLLIDHSLTYGSHTLRVDHTGAGKILFDRIEGDFDHTLYMRARYETNLKVLTRMSEIIDSYLRFNDDGSVDLLGSVGAYGGTVLREGESEGGTLIDVSIENDYSETGSAVLAIVNVNGEMPIKAFVVDREAVAEIGFKVIKLEQSDAADQFLLNRQALQYLREKRKPSRSYDMKFDPDQVQGVVEIGDTTRLYAPTVGLDGEARHRVGRITTDYVK